MQFKLTLKTLFASLALGLLSQAALAQWQWMDKDGRRVFSDRSPPAEIAEKDILKRPPGANRPASTNVAATAAASPTSPGNAAPAPALKASAPKLSGKDAELEAKKKKAEDDEATQKKAEDDKVAKGKAENCERAKTGMAGLQSGMRMATVNAKGEREVFDDAKRAAEAKRVQEVIDSSCK